MDATSRTFLTVLKSALLGETANIGREFMPEEWQKLLNLARMHQVLPMFYEAVYPFLKKQNLTFAAAIKQQIFHQVMRQKCRFRVSRCR